VQRKINSVPWGSGVGRFHCTGDVGLVTDALRILFGIRCSALEDVYRNAMREVKDLSEKKKTDSR